MALTGKKYTRMYSTTGSDADLISADKVSKIESTFNSNEYLIDENALEAHGHLIYQIQQIQEELDYLRTEISANKDKTTFPGFGTTNTTVLRGNTEIPPITIKLGTGITLTLVVELDGRGSGVVGAVVEDTRNRKTYTGSINLTEKR